MLNSLTRNHQKLIVQLKYKYLRRSTVHKCRLTAKVIVCALLSANDTHLISVNNVELS